MSRPFAVYTAVFGDYDDLITPIHSHELQQQADFYCFTDNKNLTSNFYTIQYVKRPVSDPVRCNRYFKILSHKILPQYESVLYVDANVKITCNDLSIIFRKYLSGHSIAAFKHSSRTCAYQEARWVLSNPSIDDPNVVKAQIKDYISEGFPTDFGLAAGTYILRNNKDPKVHHFNDLWWHEVKTRSKRDQLSFDYVRWKTGLNVNFMPGSWEKNFIGTRYPHKHRPGKKANSFKQKLISIIPSKVLFKYRYYKDSSFRDKIELAREIDRIKQIPAGQEFETTLLGKPIRANHSGSFMFLYRELFKQNTYNFNSDVSNPLIIDCGANIGLSIIYFKLRYPESRIIAFEPDPTLYQLCQFNIKSLGLTNVELVKKGLAKNTGTMSFYSEGSDAGRIARPEDLSNIIEIETERLSKYLQQRVDFLKIDIEGAELDVLQECSPLLTNVKNMFVEYHSFINEKQELSKLIKIIEDSGFRYNINTPKVLNLNPLVLETDYLGINFLLNIHAYRRNS